MKCTGLSLCRKIWPVYFKAAFFPLPVGDITGYTKIAVADPRFSKLASKAEVWLPIKDGKAGKFLRAAAIGIMKEEVRTLPDPKDKTKTVEYKEKFMVVMIGGKLTAVDPNDETATVTISPSEKFERPVPGLFEMAYASRCWKVMKNSRA